MSELHKENPVDALELWITTSDADTMRRFDLFYRGAMSAVRQAARKVSFNRANWHDDPEGDPEGYKAFHRPACEQFPDDCIAEVVARLFERCERVRQENIINEQNSESEVQ